MWRKEKIAKNDIITELHVSNFEVVKEFYGKLGFSVVWEETPMQNNGYLVMRRNNSILAFYCGNEDVYAHEYFSKFPNSTTRGYGVEIRIYVSEQNIQKFYENTSKLIDTLSPSCRVARL